MFTDVYIGYARSENFDIDVEGDSHGYLPDPAMPRPGIDEKKILWGESDVYWDIWRHPNSKRVDWGCSVVKMSLGEIIEYLTQDKWKDNQFAQYLSMRAQEKLQDGIEYVIAAVESELF